MPETVTTTSFIQGKESQPRTPAQLYTSMHPFNNQDQPHIYFSGPLTSGGALKLKQSFHHLTMADVIKLNGEFMENILELLVASQLLKNTQVTLPHTIGSQFIAENGQSRHWKEIEYLCFWLMFLTQLDPKLAVSFYQELLLCQEIDWNIFNDYGQTRTNRIEQYRNMELFAQAFFSSLPPNQLNPINQVIIVPDSHTSLGATFEQRLGSKIGIPLSDVGINFYGPEIVNYSLWEDLVFRTLLTHPGSFAQPTPGEDRDQPLVQLQPRLGQLEYGQPSPNAMDICLIIP